MNKIPSDDTISLEDLQRIHRLILKYGTITPQNRLAECENALAAYVIISADQVAETTRISGAPPSLVKWVEHEVTMRLLVVIQAMRAAQHQLWREFYDPAADPSELNPPTESEGTDHD